MKFSKYSVFMLIVVFLFVFSSCQPSVQMDVPAITSYHPVRCICCGVKAGSQIAVPEYVSEFRAIEAANVLKNIPPYTDVVKDFIDDKTGTDFALFINDHDICQYYSHNNYYGFEYWEPYRYKLFPKTSYTGFNDYFNLYPEGFFDGGNCFLVKEEHENTPELSIPSPRPDACKLNYAVIGCAQCRLTPEGKYESTAAFPCQGYPPRYDMDNNYLYVTRCEEGTCHKDSACFPDPEKIVDYDYGDKINPAKTNMDLEKLEPIFVEGEEIIVVGSEPLCDESRPISENPQLIPENFCEPSENTELGQMIKKYAVDCEEFITFEDKNADLFTQPNNNVFECTNFDKFTRDADHTLPFTPDGFRWETTHEGYYGNYDPVCVKEIKCGDIEEPNLRSLCQTKNEIYTDPNDPPTDDVSLDDDTSDWYCVNFHQPGFDDVYDHWGWIPARYVKLKDTEGAGGAQVV